MNKNLTAKEFLKSINHSDEELYNNIGESENIYVSTVMTMFAEYHLRAQAEAIYEAGLYEITTWCGNPYSREGSDSLDQDKIKNIYKIKK